MVCTILFGCFKITALRSDIYIGLTMMCVYLFIHVSVITFGSNKNSKPTTLRVVFGMELNLVNTIRFYQNIQEKLEYLINKLIP